MMSLLFPMMPLLSDDWYQNMSDSCEGMATSSLWGNLCTDYSDFTECREAFFWMLERLLTEGRVQIWKNSVPLKGTPQELVQKFRDVFPANETEMENGIWFFRAASPGGIVWRVEHEGQIHWID
jgi:hypothetical protein